MLFEVTTFHDIYIQHIYVLVHTLLHAVLYTLCCSRATPCDGLIEALRENAHECLFLLSWLYGFVIFSCLNEY